MHIIIDRKHKRANFDNQWNDPLAVDEAKREKARTIDIPNDSIHPVHNFIRKYGHKALLGMKVFALTDKNEVISGWVVDIIPPYYLSLRDKGVVKMTDVISMIGE